MGTYLFHPVVLTKTVMMRKASPSNGDKLPFLSLHPSGLLSREESQSLSMYFSGALPAVQYWDFPKFGMLIRSRILIQEHL